MNTTWRCPNERRFGFATITLPSDTTVMPGPHFQAVVGWTEENRILLAGAAASQADALVKARPIP
jgi:hypothetical protein